jgi:nucleotide-binding universal stress UspA family protein
VLARARRPVVLVRPHDHARPTPGGDAPEPGVPGLGAAGDVVIGLDVSRPCDEPLAFGFAAADRYGCGVRVPHSRAVPTLYRPDVMGALPLPLTETDRDACRALDEALAPWTDKYPGVPVVRTCRRGRSARDLAEAARDARLVVAGRRNRRTRVGARIGAVTHAVVHHSPAPVAVVPHD